VNGERVVLLDRIRGRVIDEGAVREKFGVPPRAIPDWLALVGDSADGYPGIPKWGPRSAAALLAGYGTVEAIPRDPASWNVKVRGAVGLAESLRSHERELELYKRLATLVTDVPLSESLEDLTWKGARRDLLEELCREIGDEEFLGSVHRWWE
jgi:5'-3' exonuclease